jgi:hypothetical protein
VREKPIALDLCGGAIAPSTRRISQMGNAVVDLSYQIWLLTWVIQLQADGFLKRYRSQL